jgi:hypothetical protein
VARADRLGLDMKSTHKSDRTDDSAAGAGTALCVFTDRGQYPECGGFAGMASSVSVVFTGHAHRWVFYATKVLFYNNF